MSFRSVTICFLLAVLSVRTDAGDRVNIRGMGMARASVVSSRGLDAVGTNPANLALPGNPVITMTVLPIGAFLESDFLTYDLYTKYLKDGKELRGLPAADKENILANFQNPLGESNAEAVARLFGITVRLDSSSAMAFSIDYGMIGAATIPREYVRLLLADNSQPSYDINQFAIKAYWARSYGFSYGTMLPKPSFMSWLSFGASVKLIQGYGYYEVEEFTAALRSANDGTLSGPVSWRARWTGANSISDPMNNLFQDPAGYGLGFDFGIAGGLDEDISFGVSLVDAGWIKWERDVESVSSQEEVDSVASNSFSSISSFESATGMKRRSRDSFKSSLPATLRFGLAAHLKKGAAGIHADGELVIATEFLQGIHKDTPLSENPRLSFGMEYRPVRWLPLRTGFSLGGSSSSHISFGLGFHLRHLEIDLATEDIFWLFEREKFSTGSIGLGIRLVIPRQ